MYMYNIYIYIYMIYIVCWLRTCTASVLPGWVVMADQKAQQHKGGEESSIHRLEPQKHGGLSLPRPFLRK
jgi:hypothetical protein